jgi:hypothetical protein
VHQEKNDDIDGSGGAASADSAGHSTRRRAIMTLHRHATTAA